MTEQFTPTTEEVRDTYEWGVHACGCCAMPDEESLAQFDRWLAKRDAEVAARAWDEGHDAGWNSRHDDAVCGWVPSGVHESDAVNPYRKAVKS